MKEPWGIKAVKIFGIEDPEYRGVVNYTREELRDIVSVANEYNWSFTAHATGEAAVELLLDVFEEVNLQKSIKGRRFSIIHGNFFSDEVNKEDGRNWEFMPICSQPGSIRILKPWNRYSAAKR